MRLKEWIRSIGVSWPSYKLTKVYDGRSEGQFNSLLSYDVRSNNTRPKKGLTLNINASPEKKCKRSQHIFFWRSKQLVIKNIIDIPMFALFWGWIHVYSYLGSSVFMEPRLDVWCALCLQRKEETSVASINQWATRSDSEDMEERLNIWDKHLLMGVPQR